MKFKIVDIFKRYIPLIWEVFFIIFMCFNANIEGTAIIVGKYKYLIYVHIAVFVITYLTSLIVVRKLNDGIRGVTFIAFVVLSVIMPLLLKNWEYLYTFYILHATADFLIILFKWAEEIYSRGSKLVLPPNVFNYNRKIMSLIISGSSLIVFFVVCVVVFYYNDVSLTAILILLFVGLTLVAIGQIISSSVRLNPLIKLERRYENDLDFKKYEEDINKLDMTYLNVETINLINMFLCYGAIFYNQNEAYKYINMIKKPEFEDNLGIYYECLFWYNIKNDLDVSDFKKYLLKYGKPKKLFKSFYSLKNKHYKFKSKRKLELEKQKLYDKYEVIVNN